MKIKILLIITILSLLSCNEKKNICNYNQKILKINDSIINMNSVNIFLDNFWNRFNEKSIKKVENETYRVSKNYFLDERFEVFTLQSNNRIKKTLNYKIFKSSPSKENGKSQYKDSLLTEKTTEISEKDWERIKSSINTNCILSINSVEKKRVLDGVSWMLEIYIPKKIENLNYKRFIFSRISPNNSDFKKICEEIINLKK